MRKIRKDEIIILSLICILFYILLTPIDYYVIKLDNPSNLGQMIRVGGGFRPYDEPGFYIVTVKTRDARVLDYVLFKHFKRFMKDTDLISYYDDSFYRKHTLQEALVPRVSIEDSKRWAEIVALSKLGYPVKITGDGVEVVEVMDDSPAKEVLQKGDVIVKIDGTEIKSTEDMIACVTEKPIGSKCRVTFKRGEKLKTAVIKTVSHPMFPKKSAFRITIATHNWTPVLPIDIEINTGNIQGPSGEMMFALEIIDRLLPEDLTKGHRIAGTGTILSDGRIGSVEGIKQKVIGAERAGIEYFLVPQGNYDEATSYAKEMKVISVNTLDDALNFLKSLN